ncbi:type VII secretion protein EccE [Rhodococcus sp. 27YEA15]
MCAQIVGTGVAFVVLAAGLGRHWAVGVGCGAVLFAMLHIGGWSTTSWVRTFFRFKRRRSTDPGTVVSFETHDEQSIGLCVDGPSLVAVVAVTAPHDYLTRVARHSFDASHPLPTSAIADCLHQHDISLSGIDIVAHGYRMASGTAATDVYDRLIGPLPATAIRSVWLAVRFDAATGHAAAARRGGGEQGAGRAVTIATHRIVRVLDRAGCSARILTAPEIASSTAQVTRGTPIADITETWRNTPLPGVSNYGYGIDPAFITAATLAKIWAVSTSGTSVTIRLRPGDRNSSVKISATCRFTTLNPPSSAPLAGLVSLRGRQRDSLLTNLPTAITTLDSISPAGTMHLDALDSLALPVAGCGQLVGSDENGHGVMARIFGPGVNVVFVAGELYLAQQLIFRAVATGARVLVHTDRPSNWSSLVDSIGAPDRLRVSGQGNNPESAFDTVVFDGVEGLPPRAGVTAIHVYGHPRQWPTGDPEISMVQPYALGDKITVRTGTKAVELTLVTIAAETTFIGRPRAAATPA